MGTDFAEIDDELRAVARDLLGTADAGSAVDWPLVAASGWLGLEVPETFEGAGATFAEVAVILGELGRAASASAYLGSVVLGVGALAMLTPTAGRDELLRGVASGAVLTAVAVAGDEAVGARALPHGSAALPFHLERSGGRLRLHGRAAFVPDVVGAASLLVPALDPDGTPVLIAVVPEPLAPGPLAPEPLAPRPTAAGAGAVQTLGVPVLDATRSLGHVTADGVVVDPATVWTFAGDPHVCVSRLSDRAAIAIAIDSLGLSEAMLDATVAYATVRQQFGRPIGSFQAVKHACADMLVQISVARVLVASAVGHLAEVDLDEAGGTDATVAASMAKAAAGAVAVDVVGAVMQLHGGIGYTWESGIHVYLKRATLNRSLFGSPAAHRRRLAARYL